MAMATVAVSLESIRAWGRSKGIDVGTGGKVSNHLISAFEAKDPTVYHTLKEQEYRAKYKKYNNIRRDNPGKPVQHRPRRNLGVLDFSPFTDEEIWFRIVHRTITCVDKNSGEQKPFRVLPDRDSFQVSRNADMALSVASDEGPVIIRIADIVRIK